VWKEVDNKTNETRMAKAEREREKEEIVFLEN